MKLGPMAVTSTLTTALTMALAGALSACGGPDAAGAPTDATVEDFCAAVGSIGVDSDADEVAEDLAETGTPEGISESQREGFETLIDNAPEDEVSADQQKSVDEFFAYYATTCTPVP